MLTVLLLSALQVIDLPAAGEPQDMEPILGWNIEPPAPTEGEESELDRLSQSSSGAGFLEQLYGAGSDDERVPINVTLRALDKITARFTDVVVPIGEAVQFGTLTLLPRTCSTRPPEEFPETTVFLEVYAGEGDAAGQRVREASEPDDDDDQIGQILSQDQPPVSIGEQVMASIDEAVYGEAIFKGWMFASSPSLNAIEHPTYDVWVINCTMEDPEV